MDKILFLLKKIVNSGPSKRLITGGTCHSRLTKRAQDVGMRSGCIWICIADEGAAFHADAVRTQNMITSGQHAGSNGRVRRIQFQFSEAVSTLFSQNQGKSSVVN